MNSQAPTAKMALLGTLCWACLAGATGCDFGLGGMNLNIYIPLGLNGGAGLLHPAGSTSLQGSTDTTSSSPPIPTQIGPQENPQQTTTPATTPVGQPGTETGSSG